MIRGSRYYQLRSWKQIDFQLKLKKDVKGKMKKNCLSSKRNLLSNLMLLNKRLVPNNSLKLNRYKVKEV